VAFGEMAVQFGNRFVAVGQRFKVRPYIAVCPFNVVQENALERTHSSMRPLCPEVCPNEEGPFLSVQSFALLTRLGVAC
jgi:hypothetical protein